MSELELEEARTLYLARNGCIGKIVAPLSECLPRYSDRNLCYFTPAVPIFVPCNLNALDAAKTILFALATPDGCLPACYTGNCA